MGFKIVTDSTTDLPKEYLEEQGVVCVNLCYTICGETYGGTGKELDWKEFYSMMRNGNMPSTSQVNPEEFKMQFQECMKDTKEILYLAFSSGLSGTCGSARIAARELMEENPDVKIRVVDTLQASMGEGLVVYKAIEMKNQGKSMEEIAEWVEKYALNFIAVFTVDDLNHLYRGGRVNKATAIIGTIAAIKPLLHVDNEGHLVALSKTRGRKKSLLGLVDLMEEKMGAFKDQNDMIMISHGDALEDAEYVRDEIKARFGFENFMINNIGPTIGAHAGPGTVALFFMGATR